jgi:hypothetical protein
MTNVPLTPSPDARAIVRAIGCPSLRFVTAFLLEDGYSEGAFGFFAIFSKRLCQTICFADTLRLTIPKKFAERLEILEARGGIEPPIKVLQTFALPLGHRATG